MAPVTLRSSAGRPLWRPLWALGVLALLLSDVWRVPHLLMVRHQVCGEHGELVHEHQRGIAPGSQPTDVVTGSASPAAPGGHHHDHCGLVATLGRSAAVLSISSGVLGTGPASTSRVLSFRVLPRPDPESVLAYAPKLSPPA
jgi:hypothetical protein